MQRSSGVETFSEVERLEQFSDIPSFLRKIENICKGLNFSSFEIANIKLAASEISTNILKYAERGEAQIQGNSIERYVKIVFRDSGPGIRFIDLALLDGYTTFLGPSLGLGLGAAKRSVDDISISNGAAGGLNVEIVKIAKKHIGSK